MTDESRTRGRVVAEARGWLGTPYHHCADIRGVGVDCGMLLVRVFVDTGLVAPFDPRPYTHDWMMHRSEERFLSSLMARSRPVETPQPGDVALWKVGRCYSHGAIVTSAAPLNVVHAVISYGRVVEEEISPFSPLGDPARAVRFASIVGAR
ncbi:MAG: hypothetical protein QM651_08020 [Rhodoblastus sp.]